MTIAQAQRQAAQELAGSGFARAEAHLAARLLLDHFTSTRHAHLTRGEENWTEVLGSAQQAQFSSALEELKTGRPLAYVLGTREFFGLEFHCDERALIPRPETELLVEAALHESQIKNWELRIADLGTGSGCIAIALAVHLPNAEIFATDVSLDALNLARHNASTHGVENRITFIAGNEESWSSPLSPLNRTFDVICSNPPYIAPREIETLPVQIKDFEPRVALDGGEDGLDCYRELAAQCGVLLKPKGALLVELGAGQFEAVRAIFESQNRRVENPLFDFAGVARVLIARRTN